MCQPRTNFNAGGTPATTGSRPLTHLFGKRALRAIRVVSHAKIFVNLEQTLLMRDRFQKLRAARIISEEPGGRSFQSAIRETRRQSRVLRPKACPERSRRIGPPPDRFAVANIFREPEWKKHVGQNLPGARFADQRHRFRRCLSSQCVMEFPKRMIEPAEEIGHCGGRLATGRVRPTGGRVACNGFT